VENEAEALLFIVNPASGGGRTRKRIGPMSAAIERAGMRFDHVLTEAPGHGIELAREAIAAGRTTLVACGGDGTVNEVANAILASGVGDSVRLGTIGMGTGKDIAKCLGIGRGIDAIRAVAAGRECRVDAGLVEAVDEDGRPVSRYFLLEAAAGWVPEISQSTPRLIKRLGDTAPYLLTTAWKMLGPMSRDFSVAIDGSTYDGHYNTVSAHNMELWGGDLLVAPGASFDDGLLDVIRWGDLGRRKVLAAIRGQQNGGAHLDIEGIDRHPARRIELSSPKRSTLDLDGERGGYLPARITIVPGALRVLARPPAL
jgi:YegS/Rv2252/BmrU family lipid kinase